MGIQQQCAVTNCTTCPTKLNAYNPDCWACVEEKCNTAFRKCAGVNPYIPNPQPDSGTFYAIVICSSVGGLIIVAVIIGFIKYTRDRSKAQMTAEDLAKLAASNQAMSMKSMMFSQEGSPSTTNPSYNQHSSSRPGNSPMSLNGGMGMGMSGSAVYNNAPKSPYGSPMSGQYPVSGQFPMSGQYPVSGQYAAQQQQPMMMMPGGGAMGMGMGMGGGQELSSYQRQYQQQQAMLARGLDPTMSLPHTAPSARMSAMAANPASFMNRSLVRLVSKFDFVAERADELNTKAGDLLSGIEEADGWWLAKTDAGVIGLIPSNYVEMAARSANVAVGSGTKRIESQASAQPDF